MRYVELDGMELVHGTGDDTAPLICVVGSTEHPLHVAPAPGASSHVLTLPVRSWGDALTPWPAKGLYREEPDFGGRAVQTLRELVGEALPAAERACGLAPSARAICGYSLGGLFALYALMQGDAFVACACLSGSVWYEGWVEHLRASDTDLAGRFAFLSIGTKERRGPLPILQGVQRNMEECAEALEARGCAVRYVTGPGNHMQHVPERFAAGLAALDGFLAAGTSHMARA